MFGDIGDGKTDGRKVGFLRRFGPKLDLGPVTDKGDAAKGLLELHAGNIRLSLLTDSGSPVTVRRQIVAFGILQGRDMVQGNHLPVAGFLFSQQGGKDFVIPAERNAGGTVPDKMDATGRVGQGNLNAVGKLRHRPDLLMMGRVVIMILIGAGTQERSRHIFFQIARTAKDGNMHGLQLVGLP